MKHQTRILAFLTATCACLFATAAWAQSDVVVNGEALPLQTIRALELQYRTPLQSGRFWYDRVSGLWGREGGPNLGQIHPNLDLGGPLAENASVRNFWSKTYVFVNGREIHPQELMYLQGLFGPIMPARYWVNAAGIGGFEGAPPHFDLRAAARSAQGGNGSNGYHRRGMFGDTGSDGECWYYNDPETGSSVMGGNC